MTCFYNAWRLAKLNLFGGTCLKQPSAQGVLHNDDKKRAIRTLMDMTVKSSLNPFGQLVYILFEV